MTQIEIKQVEKEIVDMHQFFEDYFKGAIPHSKITKFTGAMGDGFTIIAPDGRISDRETIIKAIKSAYNTRDNIRIWIENVQIRHRLDNALIATYEEWQTIDDETTMRTSTVFFSPVYPAEFIWIMVHESGLQTVKR